MVNLFPVLALNTGIPWHSDINDFYPITHFADYMDYYDYYDYYYYFKPLETWLINLFRECNQGITADPEKTTGFHMSSSQRLN